MTRPPVLERFAWAILVAASYLLAAEVGHYLSLEPGHIATCWPPSGLLLAVLLAVDRRRWAPFVIAAAAANVISDYFFHARPLWAAFGFTFANMVEAMISAWMLQKQGAPRFSLHNLPDVLRLIGVGLTVTLLSAAIGAAVACFVFPNSSYWQVFAVWWIADSAGILIVMPVVWSIIQKKWQFLRRLGWAGWLELVCCMLIIILATQFVSSGRYKAFSFSFMIVPLFLWPALRFGTATTAAAVCAMAVILIQGSITNSQLFLREGMTPTDRALALQTFLAVTAAPFLILAAMIHERKRAAEILEQKITERTLQLEEADRRKDHFLAVLAHELRNPIAPLSHALQIWPTVSNEPERLDELRQIMDTQVRQMTGLIDDLLDVSRIAGGKIQLKMGPVQVDEILTCAVQAAKAAAERHEQKLVVERTAEPLYVHGDRARLIQVVGNLLNNAVKYTGKNGIIRLQTEYTQDTVTIRVIDNGPGIPEEDLVRIFDLFTQVDQTLERSHGGLGIGLTLVKNLVELHGGRATAFSSGLNQGAEFRVDLPRLHHTPPALPTSLASQVHPELPSVLILVVDDAIASAKMLGIMLKSLGQQVELRHDGPSAIDAIEQLRPAIVLLDIAMPGMNGYDVARSVRSNPEFDGIVLVAMTGYGQETDRQEAFRSGFNQHMVKPANLDALAELVQSTTSVHNTTRTPA